jgi:hypothetical protein
MDLSIRGNWRVFVGLLQKSGCLRPLQVKSVAFFHFGYPRYKTSASIASSTI